MAGVQGIKRAIVAPMFRSDDLKEEIARFEQAYFQLAQQVNAIQNHIQVFAATWAAAVSPQTITLAIPVPAALYCVCAAPNQNVGHWWFTGLTTTTFAFNMSAPAAGSAFFTVVLAV